MFNGCKQEEPKDKKELLVYLKKEEAALKKRIALLEKEVGTAEGAHKSVVVKAVQPEPFLHSIDVQGKVDGEESVSVGAETPGTVLKVNVEPGDAVKKGQVLAELDNKVLQQGIAEVQSAKEFANTMYLKQKNLWEQKIGTEVQYLAAKNQVESLDRKLATLSQQLDMTRIKSPIDGTVDQVNLKVGQAAMPGVPAFAVVNFRNLKVKAELAESYASRVKKGDPVIVRFPDLNTESKSRLTYAGKVINPLNRTFNVEVALEPNEDVRPNMVVVLKLIDYENPSAILVPASVVQKSNEEEFILVAESKAGKNIVQRRTVKTGRSYNGVVEIIQGLHTGDKVIVTGFQELNPGEQVKI